MKYIVTKTSNQSYYRDEPKPCEEAVLEKVHKLVEGKQLICNTDTMTADIIEDEYSYLFKVWVVDIEDLEALNNFIQKYGECVISSESEVKEGYMQIEIYDTYRE